MKLRSFQPGDEAAQVAVYNTAAQALPSFKPATMQEVQRRVQAADFDGGQRFYAEKDGHIVGYATFSSNGRVSYPWTLPGHEDVAKWLFAAVLVEMKGRGMKRAFAAYRADWPNVLQFFADQEFIHARDMVNYVTRVEDVLSGPVTASGDVTPINIADLPHVLELAPHALRVRTLSKLGECLLRNPYFGPESLFVLRGRRGQEIAGVGILIRESQYADPLQINPTMPCFRLGAFGTETMQVKRVKGLFSFLARPDQNLRAVGVELLTHAALRARAQGILNLAGQVPSDVPMLASFYEEVFSRQGAFPMWERVLA